MRYGRVSAPRQGIGRRFAERFSFAARFWFLQGAVCERKFWKRLDSPMFGLRYLPCWSGSLRQSVSCGDAIAVFISSPSRRTEVIGPQKAKGQKPIAKSR